MQSGDTDFSFMLLWGPNMIPGLEEVVGLMCCCVSPLHGRSPLGGLPVCWAPKGSLVFIRISQDIMHPVFVGSNHGPSASAGGSGTVATLCGEVWWPLEHSVGCLGYPCFV